MLSFTLMRSRRDFAEPIRGKSNKSRFAAFWWSAGVTAMATVILLVALNQTTFGSIALREVIVKLRILERKLHRVPSMAEYELPDEVELCGHEIPVKNPAIREMLEREFYLSLGYRAAPVLWVKRAGKYFPYIEAELEERDLPDDLKYIAVAESDLKLEITSPAGAEGMWQFMRRTATNWNLRVDGYFDERRDFKRSTRVALNYLEHLHERFDDWLLAMVAYNGGPSRVASELEAQKVDNFFDLNLPRETERYIFRIAAIKIIMSNPGRYGLDLAEDRLYPPYESEAITLNVPVRNMYLGSIADASGVTFKRIRELNPSLVADYLPKGKCRLNLPPGTTEDFLAKWKEIKENKSYTTASIGDVGKRQVHVVRRGETLSSISNKYGVSVSEICDWNDLNRKKVLFAGRRLVIYR